MKLHQVKILRRCVLPLLSRFNPGDISISHHFTGDKVLLHSYYHKCYWYHGKKREAETMKLFRKLITNGSIVLDIGGHIGYLSLYFASLVGLNGHVYVFEPGPNNLPYIKANIIRKQNVTLIEKGAGSAHETRTFYIDNLTGQNNSFVKNYKGFEVNRANAFDPNATIREVVVDLVTLDEFTKSNSIQPSFIKIDVESFEFDVIKGALSLLGTVRPMLMVEITAHAGDIFQIMNEYGYILLDETLRLIRRPEDIHLNTVCLHRDAHAPILASLQLSASL